MTEKYGFATRAIHAGQEPEESTGAVIVPIYQTSTFAQEAVGVHKGYEYARSGNPTRTALETALAALDGGTHALAFASGLAAENTVLLMLSAGDHVIGGDDAYGGTYRLFTKVFARHGISFDFVDTRDPEEVAEAIRPETRLVWMETPTNPLLKLADVAKIAELARPRGVLTLVDNTFASPYLQRPLEQGADIVLYSTTKYMGGHSDVVGGALVLKDAELYERLKFLQNAAGGVPGPFDCWLVLRGLKTLAVRMERHSENARRVAEYLASHDAVEQVLYPGLESHPGHEIAKRQMQDFGGMISFLATSEEEAVEIVGRTKVWTLAESLGGVESLIEHPARMTHASTADAPFACPRNLIRLSVGIESVDDLIADLEAALVRSAAAAGA